MSFYANNTELKSIYFNGSMVKNVYYNNELVWGIPAVEWEDIYEMCEKRQSGTLAAFPDYIYPGMEISFTYNKIEKTARLVDIESEGPGILIFQMTTPGTKSDLGWDEYYEKAITDSNTSLKGHVKPLNKRTWLSSSKKYIDRELYFWELSCDEINAIHPNLVFRQEYTVDVNVYYPYLEIPENRILAGKNGTAVRYPLRSNRMGSFDANWLSVDANGTCPGNLDFDDPSYADSRFFCFAIG